MFTIFGIAALILLGAGPAFSQGAIALYPTRETYPYCASIPTNAPTSIYVLYLSHGQGPTARGAEYRITGMPGQLGIDYLANLTPAPGSNLNLGNAFRVGFGDWGHNVAWADAQPFDTNGTLLLATWCITRLSPLGSTVLRVERRDPPTNASFQCPLVVTDAFALACMAGGELYVNYPDEYCYPVGSEPCVVAIEKGTWSHVRTLYR